MTDKNRANNISLYGKTMEGDQEFPKASVISQAKVKDVYNQLLYSYHQSVKERKRAEEALRSETLSNEE